MKCILVVDDNAGVRYAVRQWMMMQGWGVQEATCGAQAKPMILDGQVHGVICDLEMEPGDGLWLWQEVRPHVRDWRIPFLYLAAPRSQDRELAVLQTGLPLFRKGIPGPGMPELVAYLKRHLLA